MGNTSIEWTKMTWNPVTGCTPVSAGCRNCYARRMAQRLRGRYGYPADDPFRVTLHPDRLTEPSHWKKPQMIFVGSMTDLLHPDVPFAFLADVFQRMAECPQHVFQLLTKRPERLKQFYHDLTWAFPAPLANVWLGVTVENQETADERIPLLLECPGAVRFVSCEPLLGPVRFDLLLEYTTRDDVAAETARILSVTSECILPEWHSRIDWVIVGGETGPAARPMHLDWARSIRDQCLAAGVPFFFKRDGPRGSRELDGRTWDEMPEAR